MKHFPPPYASASQFEDRLRELGAAVIAPESLSHWAEIPAEELQALAPFWDDLPPDTHLRDGGRYRFRRHGSFVAADGQLRQQGHRAHWQPLDYNALHGGLERWFEPVQPALAARPAWQALLLRLARAADALKGPQPWFIETHQFRIDTTDGIGRPTPEGAHRDGVDLVAVFLVSRVGIKGGESRVFEADGPAGRRRAALRRPARRALHAAGALDAAAAGRRARHPRDHAHPACRRARPPGHPRRDPAPRQLPGPGLTPGAVRGAALRGCVACITACRMLAL